MPSRATQKKMDKMFNGCLPIVNAKVQVGIHKTSNGDGTIRIEHIYDVIPVEVLTINFNTGGMRVRYIASIYSDEPEIRSVDIENTPYLEKYKVV